MAVGQGGGWPEGGLAGSGRLVAEEEDMSAGDGGWEVVAEGDGGDGVRVKEMAQEMDGIYPVVSAVAGAEFSVEGNVAEGIDAWVGLRRGPFDGTVDVGVMQGLVYVTPIARDPGPIPAVDVSGLGVFGVLEEVHGRTGDAFSRGTEGALVGANEVPGTSE